MTRVIFLGTPDFAIPPLQALIDHPDFDVVGVVTQPDRPAGRGQKVHTPPVKRLAERYGIPVFQPKALRMEEAQAHLRSWEPDLLVTAAFGQILRRPVLEMGRCGSVNVHASLLPRWRGAAPIQYAIRAGDSETGVTIMLMDEGLDTGPMLLSRAIPIAPDETGATLHDKLAMLGAELLIEALPGYVGGTLQPTPQPGEGITHCPTLEKEEGHIDWTRPAVEVDRLVRAFTPWPGTYSFLDGERLKIVRGSASPAPATSAPPGTLIRHGVDLAVQTGEGLYHLLEVQPEGKKAMPSAAFLAGHADAPGRLLS